MTDKKLLIEAIQKATGLSTSSINSGLTTGYWSEKKKEKVAKLIDVFEDEKSKYLLTLKKRLNG